jgi:hypothetical protein
MTTAQAILTAGDFTEESAGLEVFDRAIEASGAFKSIPEVCGKFIQPRYDAELKTARIDRILIPNRKAIDAGWRDGPIGIEAKKSGHKAGKIISQAMDYSRCVWELDHGFCVVLRWIFIWPLDNPKNDLESIMAQNRIGCVCPSNQSRILFSCGGTNGITILADGSVHTKPLPMGRKAGSR